MNDLCHNTKTAISVGDETYPQEISLRRTSMALEYSAKKKKARKAPGLPES